MQICPFCHTGKIETQKVVFVQQHSRRTIVVDRLPALVCNTCGEKTYDPRALENLQRLLWSNTGDRLPARSPRTGNR